MKNQAQLITYADRLSGGTLRDLARLLDGPLAGAFGVEDNVRRMRQLGLST